MEQAIWRRGAVSVYLGEKSGKYPDGNQVTVRGADTLVAFDTPLSANRLGAEFTDADLVILGHVHEDHMAGLHRVPKAKVVVHEADVEAARSWEGLSRHYGYGDEVLRVVNGHARHVVFILWGVAARKKKALVDRRHTVIESAHPSPLSAANGFFGSKPFSRTNTALVSAGQAPIDWGAAG